MNLEPGGVQQAARLQCRPTRRKPNEIKHVSKANGTENVKNKVEHPIGKTVEIYIYICIKIFLFLGRLFFPFCMCNKRALELSGSLSHFEGS